jgi:hypothetical protein
MMKLWFCVVGLVLCAGCTHGLDSNAQTAPTRAVIAACYGNGGTSTTNYHPPTGTVIVECRFSSSR